MVDGTITGRRKRFVWASDIYVDTRVLDHFSQCLSDPAARIFVGGLAPPSLPRLVAGITNRRVFRSTEDPNDVVVLRDVADVAKARIWFGSDEMKVAMQKGGVIGLPTVRFAA